MFTKLAALLMLTPLAHAQWYKVAVEGQSVTSKAPITVRYGAPTAYGGKTCETCWLSLSTTAITTMQSTSFGSDPAPYVQKEFDVLETSAPQTVMVNGVAVQVPATVVIAGKTAVKQWSCTVNGAIVYTIYSDGTSGVAGDYVCKAL